MAKTKRTLSKSEHSHRVKMSRRLGQIKRLIGDLDRSGYETLFVAIKRTGRRIIRGTATSLFERFWEHTRTRKAFKSVFTELNLEKRNNNLLALPGPRTQQQQSQSSHKKSHSHSTKRRRSLASERLPDDDDHVTAKRKVMKKNLFGITSR